MLAIMAKDEDISEEYILELLKKDAQKLTANYSRNGTYDVLPKRATGAAPKPNTRFLQNIIRSTDNHNAALKQKELGDAARRLRAMAKERDAREKQTSRQLKQDYDDVSETDHPRKRRRTYEHRERSRDRHDRHKSSSANDGRRNSRRRNHSKDGRDGSDAEMHPHRSSRRHRRNSSSERSESPEDDYGKNSRHSREHDRRSRREGEQRKRHEGHRSHDSEKLSDRSRFHKSKPTHQSRREKSGESRRSRSPEARSRDHKSRSHRLRSASAEADRRHRTKHRRRRHSTTESESDLKSPKSRRNDVNESHSSRQSSISPRPPRRTSLSQPSSDDDPLSSFLGPKPPPKVSAPQLRGRGTTSFESGIDNRFSSAYDPTSDLAPEPNSNNKSHNLITAAEDADWDLALEALRDRQRFKAISAERLMAAGFSKEDIDRAERGGERTEADVRWQKKGEAREWDKGKMIDDEGWVSVAGDKFGRLT